MDKKQVSLYIPKQLAEKVERIRHEERRGSVNNTYVYIIEKALKNYEVNNV